MPMSIFLLSVLSVCISPFTSIYTGYTQLTYNYYTIIDYISNHQTFMNSPLFHYDFFRNCSTKVLLTLFTLIIDSKLVYNKDLYISSNCLHIESMLNVVDTNISV